MKRLYMYKSRTTTPSGLDVKQSPDAQDTFWPIPGLISRAGVTGSVGITRHARAAQMCNVHVSPLSLVCW